jgi:Haem-binding domain/Cytochrome P460
MSDDPKSHFRGLAWIVGFLAIAFLAMQFVRPELVNPPVTADLQAPAAVKQVLKTSCYNCHSNETKLSWFDWPVPAIWLVAKDVKAGRARLNFSEIGTLPAGQQKAWLYESVSQMELGAMPLPQYERLHRESAVTPAGLRVLKDYLRPEPQTEAASAAQSGAAEAQYEKWLPVGATPANAMPAPNGIAFLPDYKHWRAISSTERDDNETLRQILGNDVAVKAAAENRINPWPDGTAFAKIAWYQHTDQNGVVRPGAFFQVEFMIRDSRKYGSTLGWGFARWRGAELKPYGKNENFAAECVGCHQPLGATNYVFTMPIRGPQ